MQSPFGERLSWRDFLRPGCLIGLVGLAIVAIAIVRTWWVSAPVGADALWVNTTGSSIKMMVWMVVGVGLALFGALLSYVEFTRK